MSKRYQHPKTESFAAHPGIGRAVFGKWHRLSNSRPTTETNSKTSLAGSTFFRPYQGFRQPSSKPQPRSQGEIDHVSLRFPSCRFVIAKAPRERKNPPRCGKNPNVQTCVRNPPPFAKRLCASLKSAQARNSISSSSSLPAMPSRPCPSELTCSNFIKTPKKVARYASARCASWLLRVGGTSSKVAAIWRILLILETD